MIQLLLQPFLVAGRVGAVEGEYGKTIQDEVLPGLCLSQLLVPLLSVGLVFIL